MITILTGDWIEQLRTLESESVQCCVTSPPYWGLRDYGVVGQLGLEKTPEEYVSKVVAGFREVRRVLRGDGTIWVNLGDIYASQGGPIKEGGGINDILGGKPEWQDYNRSRKAPPGLKPKDLVGIPWRVAFALQADGWYLRSDIIWAKSNPMPESVTDRPTKSHEYIFLMSKNQRYFYDAEAIKEPVTNGAHARKANGANSRMVKERAAGREDSKLNPSRSNIPGVGPKASLPGSGVRYNESFSAAVTDLVTDRNKRSVWTVGISPYSEAHFATFPPDLIKPCIFAGCPVGGTVLDPFFGSGTTGQVALELGRNCIGIELNPKYVELAKERTNITPGLAFA